MIHSQIFFYKLSSSDIYVKLINLHISSLEMWRFGAQVVEWLGRMPRTNSNPAGGPVLHVTPSICLSPFPIYPLSNKGVYA